MKMMVRRVTVSLIVLSMVLGTMLSLESVASGGVGIPAPEITGQTWLNSEPQRLANLKGKVILVEFLTYGCYNCRNVEAYVKGLHKQYADPGRVVIGVHAPEFGYERSIDNVERYIREHRISYAVTIDNDFATWRRYGNWAWPTVYLIDKQGIIRYVRIGEGGYAQTEQQIQTLLAEH